MARQPPETRARWGEKLGLAIAATGAIATAVGTGFVWLQLKASDEQERRTLRPYVSVSPGNITNLDAGMTPVWSVGLLVSGQSPAYGVQVRSFAIIDRYPADTDQGAAFRRFPPKANKKITLPPGGPAKQNLARLVCEVGAGAYETCILQPQDLAEIKNGSTRRLYVVGIVDYADAFSVKHQTPFCFSWDPARQTNENCESTPDPT